MSNKDLPSSVRDFLYLDTAKLSSLYAQVNRGLTEKVVTERRERIMTGEVSGGLLPFAQSADSRTEREAHRGESVVLHDHMFNEVEEQLQSILVDGNSVSADSLVGTSVAGNLVRVSGQPSVEDFEYLHRMFSNHREIHASINLVSSFELVADGVRKHRMKMQSTHDVREAERLRRQLERLPEEMLDKGPGSIEPLFSQSIARMTEYFKGDSFEVVLSDTSNSTVSFRGVLDRQWLRYTPQTIRELYGQGTSARWTMVGFATSVQLPPVPGATSDEAEGSDPPNGLGAAFSNMFRVLSNLEKTFRASDRSTTLILMPVAIYRDFTLGRSAE